MNALAGALCKGQHELFESTHLVDHKEAAALCARCPAFDGCQDLARSIIDSSPTASHFGLTGTWAGKLFGVKGLPRPTFPQPVESA